MQSIGTNPFACSTDPRTARGITIALAFASCFVLGGCHNAGKQAAEKQAVKPVLSASPNPVPAGDLDQPLGASRITWNTGSRLIGDLYMKVNRSPEVFLARGSAGVFDAKWIQFDSLYEFRLYNKKRSRLIAKVEVTRDD